MNVDENGLKVFVNGSYAYKAAVQKELTNLCKGAFINFNTGEVSLSESSREANHKGYELLSTLISSDKNNTIWIGNSEEEGNSCVGYSSDFSMKNGEFYGIVSDGPKNSIINFNPDNWEGGLDDNGSTSRPPYIGLAHEMGHSEANNNGTQTYERYNPIPGTTPNSERNSINRENEIRKENNLTPRSNYFYKPCENRRNKYENK